MMNNVIVNYNVGDTFEGFLLVKNSVLGTAKNGKPYLSVTLGDISGDIAAMVWDADEVKKEIFAKSNILKVEGTISEYQGRKQINLFRARIKYADEKVDIEDLLKSAPISSDTLLEEIFLTISAIANAKIKKITKEVFTKYMDDFKVYPAAKSNHHAYVSGLAYHTYSMLNIAKGLADLYPFLNKDLLFAGVILHDIGKIREYTGIVATDYTLEGKLIGHISMISEEIGQVAKELEIEGEEVLLLQHMVLSHHGKLEWGSPVTPIIPEALVLHQIDNIDASLDALKREVEKVEIGRFTEKIFSLDNRSFYNHGV